MKKKKTLKDRIGILSVFNRRFVLPTIGKAIINLTHIISIGLFIGGVLLILALLFIAPFLELSQYYDVLKIGLACVAVGLVIDLAWHDAVEVDG